MLLTEKKKKKKEKNSKPLSNLVSEASINQPNRIESRLSSSARKGRCYLIACGKRINHFCDIH